MSEFKVGTSGLTGTIFAGKVLKNGTWGANKKDVTGSAVQAVASHLIIKKEAALFQSHDGKFYRMQVEEISESQYRRWKN